MHKLKRGGRYRIVTILVAVPAELEEGEVADGLNEILRPALEECGDPSRESVIDDYEFSGLCARFYLLPESQLPAAEDPEEGEVFGNTARRRAKVTR